VALNWALDGVGWPLREHSLFVDAAGLRWHVQHLGGSRAAGPRLLLVHGTGASTHSWRDLMPLAARSAQVLACDLPGHGFSAMPPDGDLSLPGLAARLAALLRTLDFAPDLALGHSAGAAVLAQMVLHERLALQRLVAVNGAFLPFGGVAAPLFTPLARVLHSLPAVPRLFARRAHDPAVVRRLVEGTGSTLDDAGLALYGRLIRDPDHSRAALGMMAHWDLRPLARELPRLGVPLLLLAGQNDRAVPPSQARRVAGRVPGSRWALLPRVGHLAHEEAPRAVLDAMAQAPRAEPLRAGSGRS
jgi:magnesium chelatase accessory protein